MHSDDDELLEQNDYINIKKDKHVNKKDEVQKEKNVDKQLRNKKKDTIVEINGEKLINQIEHNDSDLNNDIVMARLDLLVHIFSNK